MLRPHRPVPPPPAEDDLLSRLASMRPIAASADDRQSREDRLVSPSLFDIPVPLPRFLLPPSRRPPRR